MSEINVRPSVDLTRNLSILDTLTEKVASVHGHDQPSLLAVRESFSRTADALIAYTEKKSSVESAQTAARHIAHIRELTGNYCPPAHACRSYRAMLDGLSQLDQESGPILQASLASQ